MADYYVWLGNDDHVANGNLKFAELASGNDGGWKVWPLLRWQHDEQDPSNDTLSLAALIQVVEDHPLQEMLLWLGKRGKPYLDNSASLATHWQAVHLDQTTKISGQWALGTSLPSNPVGDFVAMPNLTATATLDGDRKLLPFLEIENDSKCELASDSVVLTLKLKGSFPLGIGDKTVTLELSFKPSAGSLKCNNTPISGDPNQTALPIRLGQDGSPWFVAYKENSAWKATLVVPIPEKTYSHTLLRNFPAKVDFTWKKSAIRLDQNGVAIVVPPDVEQDDLIAEAVFQLPLIQSGGDDPLSNAVAQLVTVRFDEQNETQNVLTYKFELYRDAANELLRKATSLIGAEWNGGHFTAGEHDANALGQLQASLVELVKTAELDSFVGRLADLTGAADKSLKAKLSDASKTLGGVASDLIQAKRKLEDYPIPLALEAEYGTQKLAFLVVLRLNLWTGRLSDDRAYFYIAEAKGDDKSGQLDLDILHLTLPPRENLNELPNSADHDGFLDFRNQELVLNAKRKSSNGHRPATMLFPGKLTNSDTTTRLRLVLHPFDPSRWPDRDAQGNGGDELQLRLGSRGITLYATADTTQSASIPVEGTGGPNLPLRLQEDRQGLKSEIVIIDNQIRYASLFGTIAVPGFDNLEADVHLGLRQSSEGSVPAVIAEVDLQKSDQSPLARLRTPWFQGQLDELRMRLDWETNNGTSRWKVDAWASGALSFSSRIGSTGGVEGMDSPRAIPFRDLKLTELHKPAGGKVTIGSAESPARFELLDGMFRVEFYETEFDCNLMQKSAELKVQRARFQFQKKDEVDVAVDAGGFTLQVTDGRVKLSLPSTLGLSLQIKDSVRFRGEISWVDNPTERYFAAGGSLTMSGFPEVAGMLKIGTGRKENGKMAPNIAIYGAFNYEAELFSGVTLKRIGVGLGVNNRLRALGADPRPEEIIKRIDQLTPEIPSAWSFVTDKGTYVSIVASALIGSNRGSETTVNAYLAWLILSIDTNLDIIAAGKFWLFSSPKFIGRADNANRPALVGAMALRPRKKTLSFVAETRPRPAIEANSQLQEILNKARARYSFYLSPQMADSYLEELSYADKFFGVPMVFTASYRMAIGKFGAMMRASLAIRGHYSNSLSAGIGGFSFAGTLGLDAEFGGLISPRGLAAYGTIDVRVRFEVSAFIYVPGIAWETRRFEKTVSISFTVGYMKCKRWRCRWKTETVTRSWTIIVDVPVPVPVMNRYESGPQHLALRLRGGVAFDESGSFGFLGEVSISTRVAGFKLEVSPAMRFNPAIVDQVRKRVAAVENHLNALRGISRPAIPGTADDGDTEEEAGNGDAGSEKWFHYTSQRAGKVYHVLVPSPEYPDAWYTPESYALSKYSNLPLDYEHASDAEKNHRSPFRNAVMRMQLTFANGTTTKLVDLTMPWDRLNMDALPPDVPQGNEAPPTNDDRVKLLIRLSEMETAFLNTAAERDEDGKLPNGSQCLSQHLDNVKIVSDPRVESNARQFWTLQDQRTRPDYAPPAVFRLVDELVSEGFAGLAKQGDIGRLLLYDRLSRRAARLSRHDNVDPTEQERLAQARGAIVSLILDDLQREDGPRQFGKIEEIMVEREGLVARRRAPIFVKENDQGQYAFSLTKDVVLNSTDLDLQGAAPFALTVNWGDESQEETAAIDPTLLGDENDHVLIIHNFAVQAGTPRRFYVTATRSDISGDPNRCSSDVIVVELVEGDVERQVGLVVERERGWTLHSAKIIRFAGKEQDVAPVKDFIQEKPVDLLPISNGSPKESIERIHDRIDCLPACQQFVGVAAHKDNPSNRNASQEVSRPRERVRVSLPVKFHEELLRNHLPELNRFQIFRQFPWETAPVLVDDRAFPQMQDIEDQREHYRLVDSFVYTEDFELDEQRRFVLDRLQPETTVIRYWLRAVPYGGIAAGSDDLPKLAWPPVRLYVPPDIPSLPDLAIVTSVESLKYPPDSSQKQFEIRLLDREGRQITWGDVGGDRPQPLTLEIWAEQRDLVRSGFYTGDDATQSEDREQAARGDDVMNKRSQLAADHLPRSTEGRKLLLATIEPRDSRPYKVDYSKLSPGYAYRLLVRLEIPAEDLLLTPVPMFLVRRLPVDQRIEANTPMRSVETVEFITESDWKRILDPEDPETWLPEYTFDATPLTESPSLKNFPGIQFGWSSFDESSAPAKAVHDGGVEILIQDFDESHRLDRMLVEVQDELPFQQGHRDFRDASAWRVNSEISKRIAKGEGGMAGDVPAPVTPVPLHQYYLWKHDRNPVLERMTEAYAGLTAGKPEGELHAKNVRILDKFAFANQDPNHIASWTELHNALTYWFAAVFDYQRTPLAVGDSDERNLVDAMVLCAVQMFQGIDAPAEPDLAKLLPKLEEREEGLRVVLDEITRSDPRGKQIQDRDDEYERMKWELRDFDTADRLAKIILRRRACAEELFKPEEGGIGSAPEALNMDSAPDKVTNKRLPRADAWDDLVALYAKWKDEKDEQGELKYAFPLTKALLKLFESQPPHGRTGAVQLKTWIEEFYQKAAAVRGEGNQNDANYRYRTRLASLVPQAAGLTAALNALKRDLGDRGWTLLPRPHHQLLADEGTAEDADGRNALHVKLDELMPDSFRTAGEAGIATEQDLSGSVAAFFNLLERLGFAVDLAVTDDLQRLLSQQELLNWVRRFPWPTILRSADPQDGSVTTTDLGYDVFVCVGREPDTKGVVDAPGALGYAFVKLAVVPRGFWTVVWNWPLALNVTEAIEVGNAQTAKFRVAKRAIAELGFKESDEVTVNFPSDVVLKFKLANWTENADGTSTVTGVAVTGGALDAEARGSIDCSTPRLLSRWFELRAIDHDGGANYETQVKMLIDVAQHVDELARSESGLRFVLLEQRAERWLTVPSLGRRSHVAWTAPHRYGQRYQVAMRRISRYEPLVHWYLGAQAPTVGRILKDALGALTVDLNRCQELSNDEEATRAVQIQPHPHRIQFIYGLPDSGSRSLLSRLSSVRTGYRGIETSFAYRLGGADTLRPLLARVATAFIKGTVDATDTSLVGAAITFPSLPHILLKEDNGQWKAAKVKLTTSNGQWKVTYTSEQLVLTAGKSVGLIPLHEENGESPYLAVWAIPQTAGTMVRLSKGLKSLDLSSVDNAYKEMVAEFINGTISKGFRIVTSYSAADRTIELNDAPPPHVDKVYIWRLEPLVHRESIPLGSDTPARLFRHERMLSLSDVPYFFEYNLRAEPVFDAPPPDANNTIPAWARRRPAALGVKRASITSVDTASKVYEFTVYFSRLEDHLTPREAERLKLDFATDDNVLTIGDRTAGPTPDWHRVRAEQLPDLAMAYHIMWKAIVAGDSASDDAQPFYVPAVDVILPSNAKWTEAGGLSVLIRSRSPKQVEIMDGSNKVKQLKTSISVNRWSPKTSPVYSVTFRVQVNKPDEITESLFEFPQGQNNPPTIFLQASRDGVLSRPLPLEVLP